MEFDRLGEIAARDKRLISAHAPARRAALRICAPASGLSDKAVSLLYERVLRTIEPEICVARCRSQIEAVLDRPESAWRQMWRWRRSRRLFSRCVRGLPRKKISPASVPAGLEVWSGLTESEKDPPSGTGVGAVPIGGPELARIRRSKL